jgi:hypothetical protein
MASNAIFCHMHVCESLFKSLSIATNSRLVEETEELEKNRNKIAFW